MKYSILKSPVALIIILSSLIIITFCEAIISLTQIWSGRPDYSHGYIVPFASGYFIYAMRDKLRAIAIEPSIILGSAITAAGIVMLMLGKTGGMITAQQLSILVVIPGLVITIFGITMFKALLLPLGYLVLMIPLLLDIVFYPLHWPFQLFGAKIAALIMGVLGIPVFQAAQYIELPNMPLEVANACSGIRYLVSITALAVPLAYLVLDTWPRRVFLILSSLLVGILANPIRIALIGVWVYGGGTILHGPGHMLQGYFVSVVGYGFVFGAAWMMSRGQKKSAMDVGTCVEKGYRAKSINWSIVSAADCRDKCTRDSKDEAKKIRRALTCAMLIVLAAGIFVHTYSSIPVPLKIRMNELPLDINGWQQRPVPGKDGKIAMPPNPDSEMVQAYRGPQNETVVIQISYYDFQEQEKEFIHYTLNDLYEGARPVTLEVSPGKYIEGKQVLRKEQGMRQLVTYWYDIDGHVTSSNINAKIITALRGLLKLKTNGAVILVASNLNATDRVEKASEQQAKFAAVIYPSVQNYLLTN